MCVRELWCLTPLSTIFQLYHGGQFIGGGNWINRSKPLGQTLLHNVVLSTPSRSGIRTHNISGDRHRLHR